MAPGDSMTGQFSDRQRTGADAAPFEELIGDIAGRFGLGTNAGPLVREVLKLITGAPGGVGGFLDKFRTAGLGPEMMSWLGRKDAPAVSTQQLERALGPSAIEGIAGRLGLDTSAASTAVAYILPKLIGALTPGGTIPTTHPSESPAGPRVFETVGQRIAAPPTSERVAPRHIEVVRDEPHMVRWLWPLLGALALLGLGSYLFSGRNPAPAPVAVQTPAALPSAPAPALPARLSLSNDNGIIHYSGSVHDEETRTSIINSLKAVFGADRIQGDIGIDLNRSAVPWLINLRTALETLKVQGVQVAFDGNSVNLGGIIGDAERDRITNSLRNVLGSGLVFGTLTDRLADMVSGANNKVIAALTSLKTGFNGNDLTATLNQSIINFPSTGSEVPAAMTALLEKVATQMKQLAPGTVLEVAAYTDNSGDAAANVALSQQRADAVRNALIHAGVDPSMLVAKGYGSANPIASNDLLEGRFRNRRIEYRVLKP
jgi:OmpA-OmpF porin, OOP family